MITKLENFLNQDQIDSLIGLTEKLPSRPGDASAGNAIKTKKKSTVYDDVTFPGSSSLSSNQRNQIHSMVFHRQNMVDRIANEVTCGEFSNVFSSIAVYNEGDFYDWHLDRLTTGQGVPIDISYTIFLNDPEEYMGGSLLVKHDYGTTTFKEKAGTAVFYPSACLHRVDEVVSGSRKVVLGLINCTVSSPHDRHLLTELTNCIHELDEYSDILSSSMIDTTGLDDINRSLHYIQMQLNKRFMKH